MTVEEVLTSYGYPLVSQDKLNYKILCPFHDDSVPSLAIMKDTGVFKCWSCGVTGNLVNLISKIEGISYEEAYEKLIGNNVEVVVNTFVKKSDENSVESNLLERYYKIKNILNLLYFVNAESFIDYNFYEQSIWDEPLWIELKNRQNKLINWEDIPPTNLSNRRGYLKYVFDYLECIPDKKKYSELIEFFKISKLKDDLQFINNFLDDISINEKLKEYEIVQNMKRRIKLKIELLIWRMQNFPESFRK